MAATAFAILLSLPKAETLSELISDTARFWFALAYLLLTTVLSEVRQAAYARSLYLERRRRARTAARRRGGDGGTGGGTGVGGGGETPAAAPTDAPVAPAPRVPRPQEVSAALRHDDEAAANVYSIYVHLRDWNKPHYRAPTFGEDVRANLANVAAPGTGVALSALCRPVAAQARAGAGAGAGAAGAAGAGSSSRLAHSGKAGGAGDPLGLPPPPSLLASLLGALPPALPTAAAFFLLPLACLVSARRLSAERGGGLARWYRRQLLAPRCWFAVWRANCALAALHARVAGAADGSGGVAQQYALENKGAFLRAALARGLPVAPALASPARLVAKHVNVEGGLGIHVFDNFLATGGGGGGRGGGGGGGGGEGGGGSGAGNQGGGGGGEWILQPWMDNARDVAAMLPEGAPLSTLRIVTCSSRWLDAYAAGGGGGGSGGGGSRRSSGSGDGGAGAAPPSPLPPRATAPPLPPLPPRPPRGGDLAAAAPPPPPPPRAVSPPSPGAAAGGGGADKDAVAPAAAVDARDPRSPLLPGPPPSPPPPPAPLAAPQSPPLHDDANALPSPSSAAAAAASSPLASDDGAVHVVTAVWRAGFARAKTDHSAVCFGVDVSTGRLLPGASAAHWYRLGLGRALAGAVFGRAPHLGPPGPASRAPGWFSGRGWFGGGGGGAAAASASSGGGGGGDPTAGSPPGARWSFVPETGRVVAGAEFPGWARACAACVRAHGSLLRDVPLVGWDVAVVDDADEDKEDGATQPPPRAGHLAVAGGRPGGGGAAAADAGGAAHEPREGDGGRNRPLLLEANLSLNFFGGACDRAAYASFVLDVYAALAETEERALAAAAAVNGRGGP